MTTAVKRLLFWAPRILCVLFAVFISLFALDVFGQGYGFWESVLALLIHLIPTAILLIVLAVSWRWEWVGGILCIALAALYPVMARGTFGWLTYVVISGPPLMAGILFLLNWRYRRELRSR